MEMTLSRKVLNVAGILDYIAGGLSLLLGFVIIGAGAFAMKDPELAQDLPTELGAQAVLIVGIAIAVGAIFTALHPLRSIKCRFSHQQPGAACGIR